MAGPVFLAVILIVSTLPAHAALTEGHAGRIVLATDGDVAMSYETITDLTVCYADMDGTGTYNADDSVILVSRGDCTGSSQSTDIRLADWSDWSAGTRLGSGADRGVTLSTLSPEPRFYYHDRDDDNRLTPGDIVYLRMHNADQALVRNADVRITAYDGNLAGSRVLAGDPDVPQSITSLGTAREALRYVDVLNTNSFTHHDALYLNADADRDAAGQGDVRIFVPQADLAFGAFLGPGDPESQDTIRSVNRYVCTVDESDTGVYTPGDPLYLSLHTQCTGTVQPQDLRLTNGTHGLAGSRVQNDDDDAGSSYGVLPDARVAYLDEDGDNGLSRVDVVVLRITSTQEDALTAGDVLLTPTNRGAGAILNEGDPLIGTPTIDLGKFDSILFFKPSSGATSIGDHDPFYLSPGGATGRSLKPLNVRLVSAGGLPFGGPVGLETGEVTTGLTRDTGAVCSTSSIPGEYIAGEPVYLRLDGMCPATVQAGLLRLVPVDDQPGLSIVRSGDSDIGRSLLAPDNTPQLRYFSVGESGWSYSTRLYLNIVSPSDQGIQVGDIRLTPAGDNLPAGRAVLGGDTDRNVAGLTLLGDLDGHTGYVDVDRSNNFGSGDHAYITPTQVHDHVTPLTVRLTALPDPFEPLTVAEPADPSTTEDETASPDDTDKTTDSNTQTDPEEEEESTPGAAVLTLLVAIAGLVTMVRRGRKQNGSH